MARRPRIPSVPVAPVHPESPDAVSTISGPTRVLVLHQFQVGDEVYNPSSQAVTLPAHVVRRELARGVVRLASPPPSRLAPLPVLRPLPRYTISSAR